MYHSRKRMYLVPSSLGLRQVGSERLCSSTVQLFADVDRNVRKAVRKVKVHSLNRLTTGKWPVTCPKSPWCYFLDAKRCRKNVCESTERTFPGPTKWNISVFTLIAGSSGLSQRSVRPVWTTRQLCYIRKLNKSIVHIYVLPTLPRAKAPVCGYLAATQNTSCRVHLIQAETVRLSPLSFLFSLVEKMTQFSLCGRKACKQLLCTSG